MYPYLLGAASEWEREGGSGEPLGGCLATGELCVYVCVCVCFNFVKISNTNYYTFI